jgi:putative transposase
VREVHESEASDIRAGRRRTRVLAAAYAANPRRFCNRRPTPPKMPTIAWINKPTITNDTQKKT